MPKRNAAPDLDSLAARMRQQQEALSRGLPGEGAQQQVMAGFAEAYRAWLEAMSAKPETMLDLQSRYMQEQLRLWMKAMQPDKDCHFKVEPAWQITGITSP